MLLARTEFTFLVIFLVAGAILCFEGIEAQRFFCSGYLLRDNQLQLTCCYTTLLNYLFLLNPAPETTVENLGLSLKKEVHPRVGVY